MARIIVVTSPFLGHVNVDVLFVKTLVKRGNEVVWYTGKRFKKIVEDTGATHVGMEKFDFNDRDLESSFPGRQNLEGLERLEHDMKHLFMDGMFPYHEEIQNILATFPADVIAFDHSFFGAFPMILSGEPKGLKFVTTSFIPLTLTGPDVPPFGLGLPVPSTEEERARNIELHNHFQNEVFIGVQNHFNSLLVEHDYPQLEGYWADACILLSDLFLQFTIQSFEYPRANLPEHVHFVGTIMEKGQEVDVAELPDWWNELEGERPVVHVTQGTVDVSDFKRLIQPTIEALADKDVLVVVATGERSMSNLDMVLPDNVRVGEFIPYSQFLPHVDVMVTNAGNGGVQQALLNGVPLVAAGDTEEKPEVAQRVAWSGVGINLGTGAPTVEQIREAVEEVLDNPKYLKRAKAFQEEYAQLDGANEAARLIEELASDKGNKR